MLVYISYAKMVVDGLIALLAGMRISTLTFVVNNHSVVLVLSR